MAFTYAEKNVQAELDYAQAWSCQRLREVIQAVAPRKFSPRSLAGEQASEMGHDHGQRGDGCRKAETT